MLIFIVAEEYRKLNELTLSVTDKAKSLEDQQKVMSLLIFLESFSSSPFLLSIIPPFIPFHISPLHRSAIPPSRHSLRHPAIHFAVAPFIPPFLISPSLLLPSSFPPPSLLLPSSFPPPSLLLPSFPPSSFPSLPPSGLK
jgi:hypothetical protein